MMGRGRVGDGREKRIKDYKQLGRKQPPEETIDQISPAYTETDWGIPSLPCAQPGDDFSKNDFPEEWKGVSDCFRNRLPNLIFKKKNVNQMAVVQKVQGMQGERMF